MIQLCDILWVENANLTILTFSVVFNFSRTICVQIWVVVVGSLHIFEVLLECVNLFTSIEFKLEFYMLTDVASYLFYTM